MVTCWERADLLALLCVVYLVSFPNGILGQVWYSTVSILDLCLPNYFFGLFFWGGGGGWEGGGGEGGFFKK